MPSFQFSFASLRSDLAITRSTAAVPMAPIERNRQDLARFVRNPFKRLGTIGRVEPSALAHFYDALMIDA